MAAPEHDEAAESPAVASNRGVDIAVSVALLAVAGVLAFDNWRTGMGWDATGPQAGYFPFYLALILAGSSIYGIFKELAARHTPGEAFVRRGRLKGGREGPRRRGIRAAGAIKAGDAGAGPDHRLRAAAAVAGPLRRELPAHCRL